MKTKIKIDKLKKILPLFLKVSEQEIGSFLNKKIFIKFKKDFILFRSANINSAIEYKQKIESPQEMEVVLPSDIFYTIVSTTNSDSVEMEVEGKQIIINTKNGIAKITTLNNDEGFPEIPKIEEEKGKEINTFNLDKQTMLDGLQNVFSAASQSVIKPEFSGVFMCIKDNTATFVSTDAHRLFEMSFKTDQKETSSSIIPIKGVHSIIKICTDIEDGNLKITTDKQNMLIEQNDVVFYTRLVDGDFPEYKHLIPKKTETKAVLLKADLINFFKKAKFFSNKFKELSIKVDKDGLVLSFRNAEIGEVEEFIKASVEGNQISKNLNYQYVVDALRSINEESLVINFSEEKGQNTPIIIKGATQTNFTSIITPLIQM